MNWHEDLPQNCPPSDAESPDGRTFYRLCKTNPADTADFISKHQENPNNTFAGVSTCILRAVSIWNDKNKCAEQRKFKTQRDKLVGEIILSEHDGLVKQTFQPSHYSWWRSDHFNPNITVIVEN